MNESREERLKKDIERVVSMYIGIYYTHHHQPSERASESYTTAAAAAAAAVTEGIRAVEKIRWLHRG